MQFLGDAITRVALTSMFRVIGKLDNLTTAAGSQGKVYKVSAPYPEPGQTTIGPWYDLYLTESHDALWPFPQSKFDCGDSNFLLTYSRFEDKLDLKVSGTLRYFQYLSSCSVVVRFKSMEMSLENFMYSRDHCRKQSLRIDVW